MPAFAEDVLGGGPWVLGVLTAASGAGALAGALYLASRRTVLGLGRVIVVCTALFGLALIGFALSRSLWLSLALMALAGFGMMVQMAASNTILQTVAAEDRRGRVMSLFGMAFMGMAPFGSLLAGALSGAGGVTLPVLLGGVACLAGAGVFALNLPRLRREVRPHYVQLGILPEVASGLGTAAALDRLPPS
jgi:MFS family permease